MDRSEVEKLLDDADKAITELENPGVTSGKVSRWTVAVIILVVGAAVGLLVLHTFFEDTVKVDATSGVLIAVILLTPFVRRLKAVEIAGLKAEFHAAGTGMRLVVKALRAEHGVIKGLAGAPVTDPDEVAGDDDSAKTATPVARAQHLQNVLWIDRKPERSVYEREELAKLFRITIATALPGEVLEDDTIDAIVAVGVDGYDDAALEAVAAGKPVVVYAPTGTAPARSVATAAEVVTSLPELVRTMRELARERFDESVARVFRKLGLENVIRNTDGIDYTIVLAGDHKIVVDTPHWLRRPRERSLKARYDRLADAARDTAVSGALLVTQKPFSLPLTQPDGVRPVVLDDLADVLGGMVAAGRTGGNPPEPVSS